MVEQEGNVVSVESDFVYVDVQKRSSCSQCDKNQECGESILSSMFPVKKQIMKVKNTLDVQLGDRVTLGIEEGALVMLALLTYLLPLLFLVIGALMGGQLQLMLGLPGESGSILLGLAGLLLGFVLVRRLIGNQKRKRALSVRLVKRHIAL